MEKTAMPSQTAIEIRHLANAGFLISGRGKKILIDGLYGKAPQGFSALPEETRADLLAGRPPFDGITHILISHYHPDHFDLETVRQFLECHPCGVFLPDDDRRLRRLADSAPQHRVGTEQSDFAPLHRIAMERPGRFTADLGDGDLLGGFIMRHSGLHYREMTVICFSLTLAGRLMLFLSDADFDPEALREGLGGDGAEDKAIPFDLVFTNPLFLDLPGGREILFSVLDANEIVIAHMPLEGDDIYAMRDLPERCIEAYGLPSEKMRLLKETGEVFYR